MGRGGDDPETTGRVTVRDPEAIGVLRPSVMSFLPVSDGWRSNGRRVETA
jgi:hypothetical protein